MCSEAALMLSLVMRCSELCGAFPYAKLIRCSFNSASVTTTCLDRSSIWASSGSGSTSRRNCFRSAISSPFGGVFHTLSFRLILPLFFHRHLHLGYPGPFPALNLRILWQKRLPRLSRCSKGGDHGR